MDNDGAWPVRILPQACSTSDRFILTPRFLFESRHITSPISTSGEADAQDWSPQEEETNSDNDKVM
jgi:hypothetical protein